MSTTTIRLPEELQTRVAAAAKRAGTVVRPAKAGVFSRSRWSKVDLITGKSGKWVEGGREADGLVVAIKRSNVRGAKVPCCIVISLTQERQGRNDKNVR
ncbi:hypothetical protein [Candidatus Nitrotoga sp. BS]|uniref:hypothetical protein n=1 Tax=Candidatus Nitrotoga sp. BS TaxID=2890408 RepID=UPI001EF3105B|nr:hypothetical protein [Candidatus Nitrotoga sp. BS]